MTAIGKLRKIHYTTAPTPQECPDKHGLIEDIRLAMRTIVDFNNRQMEAVIAGDFGKVKALQAELVETREWKDSLIEAYRKHLEAHGC